MENECGKSGHLSLFHFFEALNDTIEVQFIRASFLDKLSNSTDSIRAMQLRFFINKVEHC